MTSAIEQVKSEYASIRFVHARISDVKGDIADNYVSKIAASVYSVLTIENAVNTGLIVRVSNGNYGAVAFVNDDDSNERLDMANWTMLFIWVYI